MLSYYTKEMMQTFEKLEKAVAEAKAKASQWNTDEEAVIEAKSIIAVSVTSAVTELVGELNVIAYIQGQ